MCCERSEPPCRRRDTQARRVYTLVSLRDISLDSMSHSTYTVLMSPSDKPLVWLQTEIKSPPLSRRGRLQAGFLLRRLQQGEKISMPESRPMPIVARRCHELWITDASSTWRVIYRVDDDAIVILDVFSKKTTKTPKRVIEACKRRIKDYDSTR